MTLKAKKITSRSSNLEDEIASELSRQMCSSIDFEILSDMLVKACGWHKVEIIHWPFPATPMDVIDWVSKHCQGKYIHRDRSYIFEDQGDAVNFTLRWL